MINIPEGMEEITFTVEKKLGPAHCMALELEDEEEGDISTYFYDIWNLLKNYLYPKQADKRAWVMLRRL